MNTFSLKLEETGKKIFGKFLSAIANKSIAPGFQKNIWKLWYQILTRFWKNTTWTFMNYGFKSLTDADHFSLQENDEIDRCYIGLYNHSLRNIPITGNEVLEVGSGRGGGSSYIARYYDPSKMIGLDFAKSAVSLSNKIFADIPNLKFIQGDAEKINFPDNSFDVIINIESSHCYSDMAGFINGVARVLRPGGYFSWADLREIGMLDNTLKILEHPDFELIHEEDYTPGVIHALDIAHDQKISITKRFWPFRSLLREFAGVKGSIMYDALKSGKVTYAARVFKKKMIT
jgi:ubiquinone/menaquinone biosynthesis C-methylase UbiE